MNILISSRILAFFIMFRSWVDMMVLIKIDNSEEYLRKLSANPVVNPDIIPEHIQRIEFCHIMRQSRMYELNTVSKIQERSQWSLKRYKHSASLLRAERNIHLRPSVEWGWVSLNFTTYQFLKALPCLSINGEYYWLITQGYLPMTALLFDRTESNVQILRALIDKSATIINRDGLDQRYKNSWNLPRATGQLQDIELFCFMRSHMRFRLCALSADAIENENPEKQPKLMGDNITDYEYIDQSFNYCYQPSILYSEEVCPYVTVKLDNDGITNQLKHRLLYCHVQIRDRQLYEFYISRSRNSGEKNRVFIIQNDEATNEYRVKMELEMPLLDSHALNDSLMNYFI